MVPLSRLLPRDSASQMRSRRRPIRRSLECSVARQRKESASRLATPACSFVAAGEWTKALRGKAATCSTLGWDDGAPMHRCRAAKALTQRGIASIASRPIKISAKRSNAADKLGSRYALILGDNEVSKAPGAESLAEARSRDSQSQNCWNISRFNPRLANSRYCHSGRSQEVAFFDQHTEKGRITSCWISRSPEGKHYCGALRASDEAPA